MDGITSTCGDADDRLRLPQIPPPQSRGTEKKESQGRHHNQAFRPSGKRSSTSSHDLHPDNVLTVTGSLQISPSLKCQSSASRSSQKCDRGQDGPAAAHGDTFHCAYYLHSRLAVTAPG